MVDRWSLELARLVQNRPLKQIVKVHVLGVEGADGSVWRTPAEDQLAVRRIIDTSDSVQNGKHPKQSALRCQPHCRRNMPPISVREGAEPGRYQYQRLGRLSAGRTLKGREHSHNGRIEHVRSHCVHELFWRHNNIIASGQVDRLQRRLLLEGPSPGRVDGLGELERPVSPVEHDMLHRQDR